MFRDIRDVRRVVVDVVVCASESVSVYVCASASQSLSASACARTRARVGRWEPGRWKLRRLGKWELYWQGCLGV